MGDLLQICCIFSEHLFVRTPLDGCFCVYLIDTTFFSMTVFNSIWLLGDITFYKSLSVHWDVFQPPCCCFLCNKCFKRSPCFILSRQNQYNTKTKNLSCSKMLSCFILIKLFLTNFVCYFLFLHCFFNIALSDFFEFLTTSKLLWKHIFYIISLILKLEKKITG